MVYGQRSSPIRIQEEVSGRIGIAFNQNPFKMHVFFLDHKRSDLADVESKMLAAIKQVLVKQGGILEVKVPQLADVILIQEKACYKDFRYINKLMGDPIISTYADKVFTINVDDCATGLLRGLYTSLPKRRFDAGVHRCVPYMEYPNEFIFAERGRETVPTYLASWRGNANSNAFRSKMISLLKRNPAFRVEATDSWLNHRDEEKQLYIEVMLSGKFSLCPPGWAPVSFRIFESMALGRCPVILSDEFVPPPGPAWKEFALFYPPKRISALQTFLQAREATYEELGKRANRAWNEFFRPGVVETYFTKSILSLVKDAPRTSRHLELRRWKSLALYWNNRWTLPQRVINRARKWSNRLVRVP